MSNPLFHTCHRQYPGGTGRCSRRSLPDRWQPSPFLRRVGFRSARFEACSAFTRVVACMVAEPPAAALCHRSASDGCCYLHHPLRLLPAGATVAGLDALMDSHPLRNGAFSRRTQKYTLRVAHFERGGINLDFAVEDDVLPSAEHTHEGDQIGETPSIVAAPPQGDLASVGFQKAGIANQTGARDVGVGDRQGSVRNKRPS